MAMTIGDWIVRFDEAIAAREVGAAAQMFGTVSFWRDILALSWNLQTIEGPDAIAAMLADRLPTIGEIRWSLDDDSNPDATEGFIRFETRLGRGRGYIRLEDDRCLTLLTALEELKGFEERSGPRRPVGYPGNAEGNWSDRLAVERAELGRTRQPYVLIVGGGQGGLGLAARLRQLDVPTIVVDRFARSGDQWRQRYASLSLHDPVWYDHMPFLPFPDTWPVFTPKDKLADWLESYETLMELNVWHSTECVGARYDEASATWRVSLMRDGEPVELRPAHLVLAVGNAGKPVVPDFIGMATFQGRQYHSSEHPGGAGLADKQVVVIGSNNSAHDICADLVDHGAKVTMVQRSATHIIRQEAMTEALGGLYSEDAVAAGISTDRADLLTASLPFRLLPMVQGPATDRLKDRDAEFYAALESVGFMIDFGEDDTGLMGLYLRRASGYYIDVGASALIIDGSISLRSGVEVAKIVDQGVLLSTGEILSADIIIYATGFGSMHHRVAEIVAPEVADRVGKVWGYGSDTKNDPGPWEGELRNMWKPTAQPGLWFHGGNLAQSRFYSRFLALQLKARMEGLPVQVYRPAT